MEDLIDLDAMTASVTEMLSHECEREVVLRHVRTGSGPLSALWEKVAEQGWAALTVPERFGGLGLNHSALVPIYMELGRVAAPLPFLVTMLFTDCIDRGAPEDARAAWLARILAGEIATLSAPSSAPETTPLIAWEDGELVLSGTAAELIDADASALIAILAHDTAGDQHRIVIEREDGIALETKRLWDHGHTLSTMRLDGVRLPAARCWPVTPEAEEALLAHAAIGLAAESVGGSEGILDLTIEFMKTREQFGKPIGTFQALKHRVADHRTRAFAARHLTEGAARLLAAADPVWQRDASAAKALACAAFAEIARDCVQLHGGIGFTAEQACHLYLKRANLNALLFGDEATHLALATRHLFSCETAR